MFFVQQIAPFHIQVALKNSTITGLQFLHGNLDVSI